MILFLQNDSRRQHPIGFEQRRRNIFDPKDDETPQSNQKVDPDKGEDEGETGVVIGRRASNRRHANSRSADTQVCARTGCQRKPRFDSVFCSDACGVSSLETDLLRAFRYAGDIHPALLRS